MVVDPQNRGNLEGGPLAKLEEIGYARSVRLTRVQIIMREDGRDIHLGINFLFTPQPTIDKLRYIAFQKALVDCGIDASQTIQEQQRIVISSKDPSPFEISVKVAGPQVGQLLFLSINPNGGLGLFTKNVEAATKAFNQAWPEQRQIIGRDATIRKLCESTSAHAFQELWEQRLKQPNNSLKAFDRPVLGGGLRFVMPPKNDDPEPVVIEVKIESFLQDAKKFFIETQMNWPKPSLPNVSFDAQQRLAELDSYFKNNVIPFILEGDKYAQ